MLIEPAPQCKLCRHAVRADLEFRPMRGYFTASVLDYWKCLDHRDCMNRWDALMQPHLAAVREMKASGSLGRPHLSEVA